MIRRLLVVSLTVAAAVVAAATLHAQLAPGDASGNITVNGQTVPIKFSYSYLQAPTKSGGGSDLVLILSDQALPETALRDEDELIKLATQGKFTGIRVIVGGDGRDKSGMPFHKSLKAIISTGLYVHSDIQNFDGKTVTGAVTSGGKADLMNQTWSYDLKFHARVLASK
jgi:hypothetical protein